METEQTIIPKLVDVLRQYLADIPFCTLDQGRSMDGTGDEGADWAGSLRIGPVETRLVIDVKNLGEPRLVRSAVNQLIRYRQRIPNVYGIVAAPYISEAAGRIASEEGIGYFDLAGNCRLCFGNVYIRRDGRPNPAVEKRGLRSLYAPKAERILRALLLDPRRTWKIEPLADEAQVSVGLVAKVKRVLEDREWLSADGVGLRLTQPAKLLEDWAKNYQFSRNNVTDFYSLDSLAQIEERVASVSKELGNNYALTGFSAAERIAPMVRYQRATAYVTGDVEEIAKRVGLKPVTSGANVSLIEPYDDGVLAGSREIKGIRIVSAVQTYLDLLSFKGRGQEAAQAVLDEVIKRTW